MSSYSQVGSVISANYNNITARYNSYFIAKEKIKEIETRIFDQYQWNYNYILPIYAQYDTTISRSLEAELLDCIEKASIAIQRHPESRWEDDAYVLVGKARMYGSEFPEAIETFKWVNKFGDNKDSQHEALSELIRTFTEAEEFRNARAVIDYLKNETLSDANMLRYYLNRAYYYQKREDYLLMAENLVTAEEYLPNIPDKARMEFIAGQVHQEIGDDERAHLYYKKALKYSKTYELTFYTKLYMAQVAKLSESTNVKKVQKYFRKLLKDPKNLEYKDKIYHEMGGFEAKRGNLALAIDHYKKSIASSISNQRQKSYSYLKLAQIYYDSLANFEMAKTYYDSTISILPKDEKEYDLTKTRQEILEEFVKYIVTIKKNDSLINLTYLSADSIDALITARLDTEEEAAKERKKKLAKAKRNNQSVGNVSFYNESNQVTLSASISGDWYFYNTAAVSRGLSDFRQKWGQRDLVDNWRRSDIAIRQLSENTSLEPSKPEGQSENTEEQSLSREDMKNEMVAKIPSSPDQIALLKKEIETAYFELGKIYNFKLEEKQNAIEKFNQLLLRFPESQYKPEVLYQLYLLNAGVDSVASDQAATILIKDFPETIYAKLVINPNYIEENEKLRLELQRIYSRAYNYYRDHQFDDSLVLLDSALQSNPQNEFADYLLLLRAMCLGEIDGVYKYQYELNNFIKTHPESELATYAQKLVLISEQYQINLFSASKAKYIRNFEERHYYLILYKSEDKLTQLIPDLISEYIGEGTNNLSTGNLIFDEDYAMVLINEFAGKREAKIFYGEISDSLEIPEEINSSELISLVITKENFEIFYETKDLDSYLTFFDKHYLR